MTKRKPKKLPKPVRVWAYETDRGDLAVTTLPSVAREWDQMFRDRGEDPTVAEVRALRAERDDLLRILPAGCGSLADAATTMRDENAQLRAEREKTEAALRALAKLYQFSSSETPKYLQSLGLWREQEPTNG